MHRLFRSARSRALGAILVLVALAAGIVAAAETRAPRAAPSFYLALGDSVAYGFQPNFNIGSGYAETLFVRLFAGGGAQLVNMSCPGETSASMLAGGCRWGIIRKAPYVGSQLDAAVAFIRANPGRVRPVTLTIGANDVLRDLGPNCSERVEDFLAHLLQFERNLDVIVHRLVEALGGGHDLLVTTYYNPFQEACPQTDRYLQELNGRIVATAARHGARVVDIAPAFAGRVCEYTWMCTRFRDIHATTTGYRVIAELIAAVERAGK
jgi:lysophospholipase L1-like esterase